MQIVMWLVAAAFAVMSVPMFMGKQSFFGKSEENGYDLKKTSLVSGIFCVCAAVISGVAAYFDNTDITRALIMLLCVFVIALVVFAEKKCKK